MTPDSHSRLTTARHQRDRHRGSSTESHLAARPPSEPSEPVARPAGASEPQENGGPMKHIELGDLDVSRIGLGAMSMSTAYTGAGTDDEEAVRTIHRALDLGVTLI